MHEPGMAGAKSLPRWTSKARNPTVRLRSSFTIYALDLQFALILGIVRVQGMKKGMQFTIDHEYRKGSRIFKPDGKTARHFTDHHQADVVGVNVPLPIPMGRMRSAFTPSATRSREADPRGACARGPVFSLTSIR